MASILIIDDDDLVRQSYANVLKRAGHECVEARDGVEALAASDRDEFDVAIVDILMPIKEGLETIMALRAGGTVPKIIAVSGGGRMRNLDFLHAAKELGADRVLPKPVQRELLLSTIAEVVGS